MRETEALEGSRRRRRRRRGRSSIGAPEFESVGWTAAAGEGEEKDAEGRWTGSKNLNGV